MSWGRWGREAWGWGLLLFVGVLAVVGGVVVVVRMGRAMVGGDFGDFMVGC